MGLILAAVVLAYVSVAALFIKLIPSARAKIIVAALFVLVPFGDYMLGSAYHKYLCFRDAGQTVFKRVDHVEGFFINRSPSVSFVEQSGYHYIEGYGKDRESNKKYLRYQRDPVNSKITQDEVSKITARYTYEPMVEHIQHGLFGYFDYIYQESVIRDSLEKTILAKQVRIAYTGGWLQRVVLGGGGATCYGDSTNVVTFVTSVLRPIDEALMGNKK